MSEKNFENWIDDVLPLHQRLTESVITIVESLLKSENIEYLSVTGRTKNKKSTIEKIKRKGYKNPQSQLTDLSGIRIILYLESDVQRVSKLIEKSFKIDVFNSLNKDDLLSTDQIGYRSVHFVCGIGQDRSKLPEFNGLSDLKFEFQIRTVLQHAWAELAHDRNYKFTGSLPKKVERQLFLFAGMLEIADRGFDEISKQIDMYTKNIEERSSIGDLDFDINSVSLERFVDIWSKNNDVHLETAPKNFIDELVRELNDFDIHTLKQLNDIIPDDYAKIVKEKDATTNIYGTVRDWMLIKDWRSFHEKVHRNWAVERDDMEVLEHYLEPNDIGEFYELYES